METFENIIKKSESYNRLLKDNKKTSYVTGVAEGLKPVVVKNLCADKGRRGLVICENEIKAREFYENLSFMCKDVYFYPAKDLVFYSADIKSAEIVKKRFETLSALFENKAAFVVLSVESLFDRLVYPEVLKKNILSFSEGDIVDLEELSSQLIYMGYERCPQVEGAGQFSVRGGIIDIFSPNNSYPIRTELWGDEIDTIRTIDNYSQRSINRINSFQVYPFRELVFGDDEYRRALKLLKEEDESIYEKVKEKKSFGGVERYINYFYEETASFFDYVEGSIVFFNEKNKIFSDCHGIYEEFMNNVTGRILSGKALKKEADMIYSPEKIESLSESFERVYLSEFYDYGGENEIIDFGSKQGREFSHNIKELTELIKGYFAEKYATVLFVSSTQGVKNLISRLTDEGISCQSEGEPASRVVSIYRGSVSSFVWDEVKLAVINETGNSGSVRKRRRKSNKDTSKITGFSDLKPGDYVVHETYGIGVYKGIRQIESDGITTDCLYIEYDKGDILYVNVNRLDMVQKYIGGDTAKLKIDRIGGAAWARKKAKAKTAAKALAFDLVELYGKRRMKSGFIYSKDTPWQAEFEEAFPFEETEDQLSAINDVKRDMEAGRIMDRLICGDVGYGKTEVAIRAAFKAIIDGKQAALLAPTTILANQHYTNICERFKDYPITVEMLSRFRTKKQQDETVKGLKEGRVDFVIGTHRILSKDVVFKNLGLVIVDEEQRFGVGHKEKLKRLTENVDVLTLSATPIPRTLHMSLSGIRDMSILSQPPEDRLPIQTYVMEYSEETVRTAIIRELKRGGQVYYLHNRIDTIDETAEKLSEIVPEAKISVGHGRMNEKQLEGVLRDFIEKETNVLVCTTIIETGMDIQNVNTIIVENADFMGLSQLYQLRGRVGRTNRQAYCYLMYRKNKTPNEISEKRLKTIREFTEFGSGFKVALRDLEIRGAGDLLGASQHGHMDKIGYDMYCKILDQAIRELKGEPEEESFETLIDLKVNAFIPSTYIDDEIQKLEMYKKISNIMNRKDKDEVADEFTDRFGDYPKVVDNLMNIAVLKQKAHKLQMTSVVQRDDTVSFNYKSNAAPDIDKVFKTIREKNGNMQLTNTSTGSYLTYKTETKGTPIIDELDKILDMLM